MNIDRCGNHDFLLFRLEIQDRDLCRIQGGIVKSVIADILQCAVRSINQSVCVDERELIHVVELPHLCLILLQGADIRQIIFIQEIDRGLKISDLILQIAFDDLLPASGQLIQIQEADRPDGSFRICSSAPSHPDCAHDQDSKNNDRADNRHVGYITLICLTVLFHFASPDSN